MAVSGPCSGVTGTVKGGVTAHVIRSPGCGHGLTRHYSASSAGDLGSLLLTISWSPLVAPMLSRRPSPYRSPLPLAFTRPTILRASMCGPRWPLRSSKLACATWPRSWSMRPGPILRDIGAERRHGVPRPGGRASLPACWRARRSAEYDQLVIPISFRRSLTRLARKGLPARSGAAVTRQGRSAAEDGASR